MTLYLLLNNYAFESRKHRVMTKIVHLHFYYHTKLQRMNLISKLFLLEGGNSNEGCNVLESDTYTNFNHTFHNILPSQKHIIQSNKYF